MKTIMLVKIFGMIASTFFVNNSWAQDISLKDKQSVGYSKVDNKSGYVNSIVTNNTAINMATANIKLMRSFNSYFKNYEDNSWYQMGKNFIASFNLGGKHVRALFDYTGHLIYSITYGNEKNLPADIRKIIKSTYYDYNIVAATEVAEDKKIIWVVQMEDENNNLTVRVADGEMEETQQYVKSK